MSRVSLLAMAIASMTILAGAPATAAKANPFYRVTSPNPAYRVILTSNDRNVYVGGGQTLFGMGDSTVFENAASVPAKVHELAAGGVVKIVTINERMSEEALANRVASGPSRNVFGGRPHGGKE